MGGINYLEFSLQAWDPGYSLLIVLSQRLPALLTGDKETGAGKGPKIKHMFLC